MNTNFMDEAFRLAELAYKSGEVPIGAVIVKNDKIIASGYNFKENNHSVLDHAEIIAIKAAEQYLNNWRLDDCDIYVTLDPCPMCASAIKQSRIKNVYSALENSDKNNSKILSDIFASDYVNPSVHFISNIDTEHSKKLLSLFFQNRREK